jgi:polyhydroxybutyrate depolymerase
MRAGRWRLVAVIYSLSISLVACGILPDSTAAKPTPDPVQHASITVAGEQRTYRLFRPSNLPKGTVALVVVLHPCLANGSANGDGLAFVTHFDDAASAGGFVAVYPDAIRGMWNVDGSRRRSDDVALIGQMLDKLVKQFSIDKQRVFIAGLSCGAAMAHRVACEGSVPVTAIASVSGTLDGDCKSTRPVSVLEMHGTDDPIYPFAGGDRSISVDAVIQNWRTIDACTGNPTRSESGITKTSEWNQCKGGTVVRLDTVGGGHHTWFGCRQCDPVPGEPDANAVIWSFFKGRRSA